MFIEKRKIAWFLLAQSILIVPYYYFIHTALAWQCDMNVKFKEAELCYMSCKISGHFMFVFALDSSELMTFIKQFLVNVLITVTYYEFYVVFIQDSISCQISKPLK